ncbi:MAG: hypothetical protein K6T90_11745 [Leptolyngbyaceae cyanobacterium HOT.MB2.61]|nr:hypothetical protein [Leptolyngbyaceae cyanobacterium HOT.MB2.61]
MELRDRGILYNHRNRFAEAHQDLEDYLTLMPAAQDSPVILDLIEKNYSKLSTATSFAQNKR